MEDKSVNKPDCHLSQPVNADGFSLVELLVSASILSVFAGITYSTFRVAIRTYDRAETRMLLTQKCRVVLDQVTTDLINLQAIQNDTNLLLVTQDTEDSDSEMSQQDIISFVTLVKAEPDPILQQINGGLVGGTDEMTVLQGVTTDVQRIIYTVGPEPTPQGSVFDLMSDPSSSDSRGPEEEETGIALLRIATTTLDPETVLQPFLETGEIPVTDLEGNEIQSTVTTISDQIASFDLKYFDGENWYDSWEDQEQIPLAIQVLVSVSEDAIYSTEEFASEAFENRDSSTTNNARTITQSTLVYLLMSANFSDETQTGG